VVEKTEVNSRGGIVGGKVLTRLECSLAYHARYVRGIKTNVEKLRKA